MDNITFVVLLLFGFVLLAPNSQAKNVRKPVHEHRPLLALLEARQDNIAVPEQVHLSLGQNASEMWVTWITFELKPKYEATATVQFGLNQGNLWQVAKGESTLFWNVNRVSFVHRVRLYNLKPSSVYYYRCGTEEVNQWTRVFKFRTKPQDEENWSPTIVAIGDMGLENGVSIPFLTKQTDKGAYDAIFHNGDIAYNLHEIDGKLGDEFMRVMEPIIARVPYQTAVGNHEWFRNFSQYTNRYTMIDSVSGERNNMFYSWNFGPVHFVIFSSEWYNWYIYEGEYPSHNLLNLRIQYEWLERDLEEANKPENRQKRPWIIAAGHRGMYCSTMDVDDCAYNESILRKGIPIVHRWGLEDLFYHNGVDIILGAHEHTYERLFPTYDRVVYNGSTENPYKNPKAPFHLLVGSAGCRELLDPFIAHPKPWSAFRLRDYGVTELAVRNKTHINIRQRSTDKNGEIVDEILLIKEKHGVEAWK